jgi:hypothetical protein
VYFPDKPKETPKQSSAVLTAVYNSYWVERKVLAFSKRWPFFEALSYM